MSNWVSIDKSGIPFTTELPSGVSIAGGTVSAIKSDTPDDQSWSIQLSRPALFRLTFLSFNSSGYPQSGDVLFDAEAISNQGGSNQWEPNPVSSSQAASLITYMPGEQSDYPNDSYSVLVEVAAGCNELGRATRNYVSGYQRDQVFTSNLYANEKRCLVTNFNGAIPKGARIIKASWQTYDTVCAVMADPSVTEREVKVMVSSQYGGRTRILVNVTLDNGEVYSAWHAINVKSAPYFNKQGWMTGPQRLEAVAV